MPLTLLVHLLEGGFFVGGWRAALKATVGSFRFGDCPFLARLVGDGVGDSTVLLAAGVRCAAPPPPLPALAPFTGSAGVEPLAISSRVFCTFLVTTSPLTLCPPPLLPLPFGIALRYWSSSKSLVGAVNTCPFNTSNTLFTLGGLSGVSVALPPPLVHIPHPR